MENRPICSVKLKAVLFMGAASLFSCFFFLGYGHPLSRVDAGDTNLNNTQHIISQPAHPLAKASVDQKSAPRIKAKLRTEADEKTYRQIAEGICAMKTKIHFKSQEGSSEHILDIIKAAKENPEFFWLKSADWLSWEKNEVSGTYDYTLIMTYWMTESEKERQQKIIEAISTDVLNELPNGANSQQASKVINDWLCKNVEYETDADIQLNPPFDKIAGAFVDNKAICSGYSKAFAYLMIRAGFDCAYIVGQSNGTPHAWNAFESNGRILFTDSTFNAGTTVFQKNKWLNVAGENMTEHRAVSMYWYTCI